MKKTRQQKGITLIALIITIVVLLILAVVSIRAVQGDGIIKHAKEAAKQTEVGTDKEQLYLLVLEQQLANGEVNFDDLNSKLPEGFSVKNGIYTSKSGHSFTISKDGNIEYIETLEELDEKHEFIYYSTLGKAVTDVNNGAIGTNADADKENAVAGIYTDEGNTFVVLLKDSNEATRISPSVDMTINLGGHTLSSSDKVCIDSLGGTVTIDGRIEGSTISMSSDTTTATPIQARAGTFTVNGGTYTTTVNTTSNQNCILSAATLTIDNASFETTNKSGAARVLQINTGEVNISNVAMNLNGTCGSGIIGNPTDGTISDVEINFKSTDDEVSTCGIYNDGKITVKNTKIKMSSDGTQCYGVRNSGEITIANINIEAIALETVGVYNNENAVGNLSNLTITCNGNKCFGIANNGEITMAKSVINTIGTLTAQGFRNQLETSVANISNCEIYSESTREGVGEEDIGYAYGFRNLGTANISETTIATDALYATNDAGTEYISLATGILNTGDLEVINCNVKGVHVGVSNQGVINVNGGTYEGIGHGGFYFSAADTTSYVRNATIRECENYSKYENWSNGAGFYIGGSSSDDNITVYMDKCDIYGSRQPIVLRGASGESSNSLYISNSTINTDQKIRIDNSTLKLYIGKGNNFTADNTNNPSYVITTDEVYVK